jgi:mRNA interferase MazF
MTLQVADIVLIRMQFHQSVGSKRRPAIVLLDTGDEDFVAAPVTSQVRLSEFDYLLGDWHMAGLIAPSSVRVHKLTVLPKADIVRRLGACSRTDREGLLKVLCRAFCPLRGQ